MTKLWNKWNSETKNQLLLFPEFLMKSFDTDYILNDSKKFGQYDQNAMPSQIVPCSSYPARLVSQNEIPIESTR